MRCIGSGARFISRTLFSVTCLLLLSVSAFAVEFTTDTTILSTDYPGEAIIVTNCTLTVDCTPGEGYYDSLLIRTGGVVTHPPENLNGLWLNFAHDVTINGSCYIDVNGKGHAG